MRILVLTSVYKDLSLGNRDTSTNIVNSFVMEWVKQGHEVIVIHDSHCYPKVVHAIPSKIKNKLATRMKFSIADYDAVREKRYTDTGAVIYRIPIKKLIPHKTPGIKAITNQVNRIKLVLQKEKFVPDVITGHWASPQLEIISELKKEYNCKTACVLHGIGYIKDAEYPVEKYLKNIDRLGCRSLWQAKKIQDILKLADMPFVCYSGVPDGYLQNYELLTDKFKNINKLIITYVGRLVAYKNVGSTINALSTLKEINWEFNIVGDGADRKNLEELARNLHCEEKVKFWGRVPRDQVMEILKDTHIFVMISTNEIFGLVYLEAMAASCLTIASKNGGIDGIIVDGENGYLCEEGNSEELAEIIKTKILSKKYEELQKIVKRGYTTVSEFSDSNVARMYLNNIIK